MNRALVDKIADAVLYEGYILYPYRTSVKNRQRWTFGGLYPRAYSEAHGGSDAWTMQTQVLVVGNERTALEVRIRFLHLMARTVGELAAPLTELRDDLEPQFRAVDSLQVGDERFQSWQEAVEREVVLDERQLDDLLARSVRHEFSLPGCRMWEPLRNPDGSAVGVLIRERQPIAGTIELSAERLADDLFKVTVGVFNQSTLFDAAATSRDEALLHCLVSTHTLLRVRDGEFVSLTDPPEKWQELAAECRNVGTWPVLVGEEGSHDAMLSAPIILYDYPRIADESPGDLFDGTEIDEILTLRVLTLTDDEKREARELDERARALLQRTEALARAQLMGLHGAVRDVRPLQGG